jgi:hypothetical protein
MAVDEDIVSTLTWRMLAMLVAFVGAIATIVGVAAAVVVPFVT